MHKEYVARVEGAKTAVLMVHGIVGTPRHFDFLLEVIPEDVTVVNLLLPGHGGTVKDFAAASMKQWQAAVDAALDELCQSHEQVVLVGHSMGTLLTARAAQGRAQVQGMLYMNVPLHVWVAPRMMLASLRWCFGALRMDDHRDAALAAASGTKPEKLLRRYLAWLPRFVELLRLCADSRPIFRSLEKPAYIFQSHDDELVRRCSTRHLPEGASVTILSGCGHFAYTDEARAQMKQAMKTLLNS